MTPKIKKISSVVAPQEKLAELNAYIDDIAKVLRPGECVGLSREIMIEIATAYVGCRILHLGAKFGDPSDNFEYAIYLPKSKLGTVCSICGEPQFETPSGASCKNGHGGAEGRPNEVS
jgi:hypothetical protein